MLHEIVRLYSHLAQRLANILVLHDVEELAFGDPVVPVAVNRIQNHLPERCPHHVDVHTLLLSRRHTASDLTKDSYEHVGHRKCGNDQENEEQGSEVPSLVGQVVQEATLVGQDRFDCQRAHGVPDPVEVLRTCWGVPRQLHEGDCKHIHHAQHEKQRDDHGASGGDQAMDHEHHLGHGTHEPGDPAEPQEPQQAKDGQGAQVLTSDARAHHHGERQHPRLDNREQADHGVKEEPRIHQSVLLPPVGHEADEPLDGEE
mmetsp:Transcript_96584/g.268464  ORF Transcript_96584/g.268464 Transcript_96584/m.268464 type:complete len:258 (+) Transcript_96584:840-1613(+)